MGKINNSAVRAKQQVLAEKWSGRIGAVEKAQGDHMKFEDKGTLAQVLENTATAYDSRKMLNESTDAGATDGIKRFAMDLVTTVVPNLVANDKLVIA